MATTPNKTLSPSDYRGVNSWFKGASGSQPRTQVSPCDDANDHVDLNQNQSMSVKEGVRLNFLAPMFSIYCGHDKERDRLRKQYPWLQDLTRFKYEQPDSVEMAFEASRNAFNNDGNLFMIVLRRYVQAERLLELYFNFAEDIKFGARAQHLLFRLWEHERNGALSPLAARHEHSRQKVPFEKTYIPDSDHCSWALQMVKDRRPTGSDAADDAQLRKKLQVTCYSPRYLRPTRPLTLNSDVSAYFETNKYAIFRSFDERHSIQDDRHAFETWLVNCSKRHWRVHQVDVNNLAFSTEDINKMWASPLWLRLGRNLSSLADLVGVAADRWCFADTGSPGILRAFADHAAQQRPDLDRVQRFLHEQAAVIQRQEQVITALRFRHLLENLPGEGCTGNTSTARWREFWNRAVRTAWESRGDPTPRSPLDKLLREQFAKLEKTAKLKTEQEQLAKVLEWVTAKRAGSLYGILSQVIHGYQDGRFIVNPQSYSPDDIAILEALIPEDGNIEDGEVVWERERERYLPAKEEGGVPIVTPVEEAEEVIPLRIRRTSTASRRGIRGGLQISRHGRGGARLRGKER